MNLSVIRKVGNPSILLCFVCLMSENIFVTTRSTKRAQIVKERARCERQYFW